jgi:hypothetical protein
VMLHRLLSYYRVDRPKQRAAARDRGQPPQSAIRKLDGNRGQEQHTPYSVLGGRLSQKVVLCGPQYQQVLA